MLRKDYLLRQMEMLSALVARLLHMRQKGDESGAVHEIDQTYRDLFGLEPRLISLLPTDFILSRIRSGEYLDADQGFTLAIILREDAANYLVQGDSNEHYQRLIRSLKVFLSIGLEHNLAPEQLALYDLDGVLAQLADYDLPADLLYDLFHFYEDEGEYAQADNELHELLSSSDHNTTVIDEGISYYEWLLTLDDKELEAGNLPREEVEESLTELRSLNTHLP